MAKRSEWERTFTIILNIFLALMALGSLIVSIIALTQVNKVSINLWEFKAELGEFKNLIAQNTLISNATIQNLTTGDCVFIHNQSYGMCLENISD